MQAPFKPTYLRNTFAKDFKNRTTFDEVTVNGRGHVLNRLYRVWLNKISQHKSRGICVTHEYFAPHFPRLLSIYVFKSLYVFFKFYLIYCELVKQRSQCSTYGLNYWTCHTAQRFLMLKKIYCKCCTSLIY